MAAQRFRLDRGFALLLAVLFLGGLWIPVLWQPTQTALLVENAALQPRSPAAPQDAFQRITRGFEDSFPWRQKMRVLYNEARYAMFGVVPPAVIAGRDGWVFYRSEKVNDGSSFDDFLGRHSLSAAQLDQWQEVVRRRRAELNRRGIQYLAVIAPNKQTVYADMLPKSLRAGHYGPTRLDQIMRHFEPGILDDLRPVLAAERGRSRAYFKTDSHWTPTGAFAAYQHIAARLHGMNANIIPLAPALLKEEPRPYIGDISGVASIQFLEQGAPRLKPLQTLPGRCGADGPPLLEAPGPNTRCPHMVPDQPYITTNPSGHLPKAVIFHDSFMDAMVPFLAQNFREIHFARKAFDPQVVQRERPDVVIEVWVERYLDRLFIELPWPPPQG